VSFIDKNSINLRGACFEKTRWLKSWPPCFS
jgi:hypothetical protein